MTDIDFEQKFNFLLILTEYKKSEVSENLEIFYACVNSCLIYNKNTKIPTLENKFRMTDSAFK